jgi:hypothetical protein
VRANIQQPAFKIGDSKLKTQGFWRVATEAFGAAVLFTLSFEGLPFYAASRAEILASVA